MIDVSEVFSDIQLSNKNMSLPIQAFDNFERISPGGMHAFVALCGIGMTIEQWRVYLLKKVREQLMDDTVADDRDKNVTAFRVTYYKMVIRSVAILTCDKMGI